MTFPHGLIEHTERTKKVKTARLAPKATDRNKRLNIDILRHQSNLARCLASGIIETFDIYEHCCRPPLITQEHTQEALSTAYVHALAGLAGLNLAARSIFDYGVDGTFRPVKFIGQRRIENGHPVDFQMKATTLWAREDDNIIYDLDVKAYNWLTERERGMPMAILILLCMPKDSNEWLEVEEQHLRLRHCCYWYRDSGPRTKNKSTVRIKVPRTNILTPESLQGIMATARQEALR